MGVHKKIMYGTPIASTTVPSVVNDTENKQVVGVGLTKGLYDSQSQVKTDYSKIVDAVGIRSDVIVAGNSILGVEGTASSGSGGMDTSDGNITENDVVEGKIGYNSAGKVVGKILDFGNQEFVKELTNDTINKCLKWKSLARYLINDKFALNFTYEHVSNLIGLTADKLKKGTTVLGVTGTVVPFETRTIMVPNADAILDSTSVQINCDKLELRPTDDYKCYIYSKSTKTATIMTNPIIIEQPRFILRRFWYFEQAFDICLEINKTTLLVFNFTFANVVVNVYVEEYANGGVSGFKVSMFSDNIELEGINLDYEVIQ